MALKKSKKETAQPSQEHKHHYKQVAFYMVAIASLALFLTLPNYLTNTTGYVVSSRQPVQFVPDTGAVLLTAMIIMIIVFVLLIAVVERIEQEKAMQQSKRPSAQRVKRQQAKKPKR